LSLEFPLRLIYPVIIGIFWLTGCTSLSGPVKPGVSLSQFENLSKSNGNYYVSGRILFKHPEGKHSGEMEIHISADSELRLSIYTPLVGSLIYELRVGPEKFLLLNFQEKNYVLDENNRFVRQTWLGMDLSLTELKWLILGQIPEKTPAWQQTKLPSGELQLVQGTSVIRLRLNSAGRIESMNKSVEGLLEYKAQISLYQKHFEILFPRKIQIEDFTGNNRWLMVISEIQVPTGIETLDFIPPENMKHLISNQ
jgi:outer membrane biogenesis lipoprotein LolB